MLASLSPVLGPAVFELLEDPVRVLLAHGSGPLGLAEMVVGLPGGDKDDRSCEMLEIKMEAAPRGLLCTAIKITTNLAVFPASAKDCRMARCPSHATRCSASLASFAFFAARRSSFDKGCSSSSSTSISSSVVVEDAALEGALEGALDLDLPAAGVALVLDLALPSAATTVGALKLDPACPTAAAGVNVVPEVAGGPFIGHDLIE